MSTLYIFRDEDEELERYLLRLANCVVRETPNKTTNTFVFSPDSTVLVSEYYEVEENVGVGAWNSPETLYFDSLLTTAVGMFNPNNATSTVVFNLPDINRLVVILCRHPRQCVTYYKEPDNDYGEE